MQPNKILRNEVIGYKECEQELFDMAFMLEQSLPQRIHAYASDVILVPRSNFENTLKVFP